jgi:aldehyde:ferredoxin oxidoreductase
MRQTERQILRIDTPQKKWTLETLEINVLKKDPREEYLLLSGEPLCQYLLRSNPESMIIARGPLPYLTGNKATVGFISPLTQVPNYGYIGGRVSFQLHNLSLDAVLLENPATTVGSMPIITLRGRAPDLQVRFGDPTHLPTGQRSARYWLIQNELQGDALTASVLTIGDGAYLGYIAANIGAEGFYHAGRGGSGAVFARFASALVLDGAPYTPDTFFGKNEADFARNPNRMITPLIDTYCHRFSSRTGGTIVKLFKTGGQQSGKNTLPAWNAQNLGYAMADAGDEQILKATREGQTGCHWCQVHCRHYHTVPADYAPGGEDLFLDDFEPAYAVHAMLGLVPEEDTFEARLKLIAQVDEALMRPIEQMGLDVIDTGVALSALFEGVQLGIIPESEVPACIHQAGGLGNFEAAVQTVAIFRSAQAKDYPALVAIGAGPQGLVEKYPEMQDIVFTCGKNTLANPGHCNALWTFMMPFSRFFGHYSGQIYKISGDLPPSGSTPDTVRNFCADIVRKMLARERFWLLGNAFSLCAFTFGVFSEDNEGEELRDDDLLVELLHHYGIHLSNTELTDFTRAFWAQSIDLKCQYGWHPQSSAEFPERVYTALSSTLDRTPEELKVWMDSLIEAWKQQAGDELAHFGYRVEWNEQTN